MTPEEETFKEVEKVVYSAVHKFLKTHKFMELEEALSSARLSFMLAYHDYDSSKGSMFTTWVVYKVIHGLLMDFRTLVSYRSKNLTNVQDSHETNQDTEQNINPIDGKEVSDYGNNLTRIIEDLLEFPDASYVVNLALCPPKAIMKTIKEFGLDSGSNRKIAIRLYLKSKGWSNKRIQEAFQKIKEII